MPVHQIAVVPVTKETASSGRRTSRSKEKAKEQEGEKKSGRSRSRSSNNPKASGSTPAASLSTATRIAVTPSAQDSSSTLARLEDNGEEKTPVMPISPGLDSAPSGKRQVKRRHRRRRESSGVGCVTECVEGAKGDRERDRERDKDKERDRDRSRRTHGHSDSSEDDEQRWRESRSWSREKARRRRSSSRQAQTLPQAQVPPSREPRGTADGVELLSVGSDEVGKENRAPEAAIPTTLPIKSAKKSSSSSLRRLEEKGSSKAASIQKRLSGRDERASEDEQPIMKSYEEEGEGGDNLSVPISQKPILATEANGNIQTKVQTTTLVPCSDEELEVCRICHCEGDEECPLITPCHCTGSLRFVHQGCLHQWIKSSDTRCCELCSYQFIMETHLKPLRKWEKLHMTTSERRKIFCSVTFHLIAVACVLWSLYVFIERTVEEIRMGKSHAVVRLSAFNAAGTLEWSFWTKLIVVGIGFMGGLIFMYIQCKVYLQLWRRLKAFNRIIFVQNCPDMEDSKPLQAPPAQTNGHHEPVTAGPPHAPSHAGTAGVAPV